MKIALAQINPTIGNLKGNQQKILDRIEQARKQNAGLVIFPEVSLVGYPPEDLLLMNSFVEAAEKALGPIIEASTGLSVVVGTIRKNLEGKEKGLYNTAAVIEDCKLVGFQDKILLPDYDVFSERRYFEPGTKTPLWKLDGKNVAITICEDIWQHAGEVGYTHYQRDPVFELVAKKPDFLINLSSSPYYFKRAETRFKVVKMAALTLKCPVLLINQVGGNDSLIFDGSSMVVNGKGELTAIAQSFAEELLMVDTETSVPLSFSFKPPIEDLFSALRLGVKDYFAKLGFKKAILGLSGGIDSAVVACIAKEALGEQNVLALSLPSRFTSKESLEDARTLASNLRIPLKEISIEDPFRSYLSLMEPYFENKPQDIAEENLQARIRGTILMAFSNKFGHIVLSPGNKSEMAMGYTTLYGDMCGGLGVLSDVSKEFVYKLAHFINSKEEIIPQRIFDKPPSAELRADQKDTDSLPAYSIVDQVLEDYVEAHLSIDEIAERRQLHVDLVKELVRKIHLNEYKRRQAPPGLRVTKRAFSFGRRFPIAQHWNLR